MKQVTAAVKLILKTRSYYFLLFFFFVVVALFHNLMNFKTNAPAGNWFEIVHNHLFTYFKL